MDFFKGPTVDRIDVEGLQYIIQFSCAEPQDSTTEEKLPKIHFRAYLLRTLRSGQKLPRIELEEMGPRIDFTLDRVRDSEQEMMKEALKKPKRLETRTKKNISMDIMGDKLGRIHTGKQDLSKMQSRKMKGLKRSKGDDDGVDDDVTAVGDEVEADVPAKKVRRT